MPNCIECFADKESDVGFLVAAAEMLNCLLEYECCVYAACLWPEATLKWVWIAVISMDSLAKRSLLKTLLMVGSKVIPRKLDGFATSMLSPLGMVTIIPCLN